MELKIDLVACEGPIDREIPGLSKLQAAMPGTWFAYANREIKVGRRKAAEIDLVIIGDDRLYAVDLKDWYGTLENDRGRWLQNGIPQGRSAVRKIRENAKKLSSYFKGKLPPRVGSIFVEGFVVSTGNLDYSALPEDERIGILTLAEFASLADPKLRQQILDEVLRDKNSRPLTDFRTEFDLLMRISSSVKPRLFRPFGFELGEAPEFVHRSQLYREFSGVSSTGDKGVIRHWDFTTLPIEMQEINARTEILTREARIRDHLALHSAHFETDEWALKRLGVEDDLELLELPRALVRATNYFGKAAATVSALDRFDKLKALVATIAEMHKIGCAHTDLSPSSVWFGSGVRHKLSNLAAARIPSSETLGPQRFLLINNEIGQSKLDDPYQMDVVALATIGGALLSSSDGARDEQLDAVFSLLDCIKNDGLTVGSSEFLAQLNHLDPRAHSGATATQELAERAVTATNPYVKFPISGAPKVRGEQITYDSGAEGFAVVVKIWNSVSNSSSVDKIFSAMPAFLKARAIMESQNKAFAPVVDCGIGQGASFVALQRICGEDWPIQHSNAQEALSACRELIAQIGLAHEAGFAHGDLSPSNLKMVHHEGRLIPTFIDFIRVELDPHIPKDCTQGYSPIGDCDDFQRDAYAVAKMAVEALSTVPQDGLVKTARTAIEAVLEDGWRDASLLFAKIKAALLPEPVIQDSTTVVDLAVGTLAAKIDLESDGGCYYLKYFPPKPPEQGTLIVNGLRQALKLPVDSEGFVATTHGRLGTIDSSLLSRLRMRTPRGALLKDVQIRLVPLSAGANSESTGALLAKWAARARQPAEELLPKTFEATASLARVPISRKDAWNVFAQAESEARFQLRITGAPSEESHCVVFPVSGWQVPEDIASPRVVYRVNRHGDEVELGGLLFNRSGPKEVAVDGITLQDLPASSLPLLVIRDRRNESARDKKVAAAKRLASDEGARTGLLSKFDALAAREYGLGSATTGTPLISRDDISTYSLNPDQQQAVLGALNGDGLFLLQGPPGTGKTKTIAALVHIIATKLGSRRILVASQTHEAVNNAASKIAETFEELNSPLDLVRVGNEDDVADDLLSVHTAALRRDFVSLFAAESDSRLRPIGREIGLSNSIIEELMDIHRLVVDPLVRAVSWDRGGSSERARVRPDELRRLAQSEFSKHFPGRELVADDIASARTQIAGLASATSGAASPDQCLRFLNVISAAGDTIRRLGGGASDGAFGEFLVKTRAIACGTCVGIGSSAFKLADKVFDWAIVDEAARCTPTELAVAIQSARRVVLVGDHLQLPPFIGPEVKVALQRILDAKDVSSWCTSDFEEMFDSSEGGRANCASLWGQYRMIEPISKVVSDLAYEGKLECKRGRAPEWVSALPMIGQAAVTLVDVSHFGPSESRKNQYSTSFQNRREADWIVDWLKAVISDREAFEALCKSTLDEDQAAVGIICAYADQVDLVKERIYSEGIEEACAAFVKIGTVDSYQGRENSIVLVSLVRSNSSHSVGHVNLFQRINVALSRARDRLVVLGDSVTWLDHVNSTFLAGQAWRYINDRVDERNYRIISASGDM
jgi:tRNA A-37 threonylcarbamoyl transferase component Bud32